jgi:hypothetical protein
MSEGSNRALYTSEVTNHGRGLYSPASNRMLYALPALMSQDNPSRFYGETLYSTWDETTYRAAIADAIAAAESDESIETDNTSGLYHHGAITQARVSQGPGVYVEGRCGIRRDRFLPSGISMAGINRAIISANMGGGQLTSRYTDVWTHTVGFNDFGATLNILFTQSASAFESGEDVRDATPDATFLVSDINDDHVAASREITWGGVSGYGNYLYPPIMSIEDAGIVEKLQGFTDDTYFYMWSWFSGETLDYLFGPVSTDSFLCGLRFYTPTLRCL